MQRVPHLVLLAPAFYKQALLTLTLTRTRTLARA